MAFIIPLLILGAVEPATLWTCIAGTGLDDRLEAVAATPDGMVFAVGGIEVSSADEDGWALLVDPERGSIIWQKTYGGPGIDVLLDVARVDSCYMAVGRTSSSGSGDADMWVLLLDLEGNMLWQKTIGGSFEDAATSVVAIPGGGAVIAGYTWSEGSGGSDLSLVKIDMSGEVEWSRVFGGLGQEKAFCVAMADSQTIIAGGVTYSFSSVSGDAYLVACNLWGQELWSGYWGQDGYDFVMDLAPGPSGETIAACWSKRGTCAVWAFSVDATGQFLSERVISSMSDLRVESMEPWPGGGWVVAGTTEESTSGDRSIFAWLLTDSLDASWSETIGGPSDESCTDALVLPDGRMVVSGAAHTQNNDFQGWLVCLRPSPGAEAGED